MAEVVAFVQPRSARPPFVLNLPMMHPTIDAASLARQVLTTETASPDALAALRHLGFAEAERAWQELREFLARENLEDVYPGLAQRLVEELAGSFDPTRALHNLCRFAVAARDAEHLLALLHEMPEVLAVLAAIFSGSQHLSDVLISDPGLFDWLTREEPLSQSRFQDEMYASVSEAFQGASSFEACLSELRRFKKREVLRIGLRDLMQRAELAETLEDLSNLADVCVQMALELAQRDLVARHGQPTYGGEGDEPQPSEFTVFGLGKLGGRELNFSSDIDLIYLYTSDNGETTGIPGVNGQLQHRISNHEFFVRLAQRLTSVLHDITSDGNVFRVDLNLRPEGSRGPIVNSLRSCEIYYESWGETWERQAMMKARVIAGSRELGRQFLAMMRPFIYRRHLDFSAFDEIRAMKERIDRQAASRARGCRDVKLGHGGIREIEFTVQAFQLIHGGRDAWLCERNTLRALHRLVSRELLTYEEYAQLSTAYIFQRRLENRIQMTHSQQTHTLPGAAAELRALAAKMGVDDVDDAAAELRRRFDAHATAVHAVFDNLLRRPEEVIEEAQPSRLTLNPEDADAETAILQQSGFRDSEQGLRDLLTLRDGLPYAHPSSRSKRAFMRLLPELVRDAAQTPDPTLALANLGTFVEAYGARDALYEFLLEEGAILNTLLQLFGSSRFLAAILVRFPDVFHGLFDAEAMRRTGDRDALRAEAMRLAAASDGHDDALDALRRFKQAEELRVGVRATHGEFDASFASGALSVLAEVFLEAVLDLELSVLEAESGPPRIAAGSDCAFVIVAAGKLGGAELSFGSDLDLFFVYEDEETVGRGAAAQSTSEMTNQQFFAKLATRIIRSVSSFGRYGFAYRLDSRLRPDGQSGILANSLAGLEVYFAQRAQTWERQAMTKARVVAGDAAFGRRVIDCLERFVYGEPCTPQTAQAIDEMRRRVSRELAGGKDGWRSLKFAPGSVLDIEFLVQALQMRQGGRNPALRVVGTARALEALAEAGVIEKDDARVLGDALRWYRRLELALRIVDDQPRSAIPDDPQRLEALARAVASADADEPEPQRLLERYRATQEQVERIYQAHMRKLSADGAPEKTAE